MPGPDAIVPDMIAPCGMDCALCMAVSRKKDICPGCRGPEEKKPRSCVACKMVVCEKRDSDFCFTCDSYPCRRMKDLDKRYRTKYSMSMFENLKMIKEEGLDKFIGSEKQRWICESCGNLVSVHRDNCLSCGFRWRNKE